MIILTSFFTTGKSVSFHPVFEYDDFSEGILDPAKWSEVPGSNINNLFIDEHFVDPNERLYHTAQITPADKGVKLNLLQYTFVPGESVSFDVDYQSGSGNNIHFIDANDNNVRGIALFGTWNSEVFCAGNAFGIYHITVLFTQQGVDVQVKKPDDNIVLCRQFGEIQGANQYQFSVVTRTGDNGITHLDYDNFAINTEGRSGISNLSLPIAQWRFDEGFGTTTQDSSGNGNHGNLQNGITWTTDSRSGNALQFDGVDDRISVTRTPSVDLTEAVTLEAWIKRQSNTDGTIISRNGPFFMAIRNNVAMGGVLAGPGNSHSWTEVHGTTQLQQNVWYKVKMTYDGNQLKIYVNDVIDNSVPKIGQMPVISQQAWIGWGEPGQNQYFTGILDDIAIYDYAKY